MQLSKWCAWVFFTDDSITIKNVNLAKKTRVQLKGRYNPLLCCNYNSISNLITEIHAVLLM